MYPFVIIFKNSKELAVGNCGNALSAVKILCFGRNESLPYAALAYTDLVFAALRMIIDALFL